MILSIDNSKLIKNFRHWSRILREDASKGLSTPSATISSTLNLEARAEVKDKSASWTFFSDEDTVRGGDSAYPSALGYFLGAFGFCQQSWWLKSAEVMGMTINSLEIVVKSMLDLRGEHNIDNVFPGLQKFMIEVRVGSDDDEDKIRLLAKVANASCPVYNTLVRAAPITETIILNGKMVSG